jgi:hypothetical protein
MLLSRNPALRRHPRVLLSGIQVFALCLCTFCTLWPAATNVVALRLVQKQEQSYLVLLANHDIHSTTRSTSFEIKSSCSSAACLM